MYTTSNIHKGNLLENSLSSIFKSLSFQVKQHYTNREGLDLEASINDKVSIIGEAINWRTGFIHPYRFNSITGKLSEKADLKFFFCSGVQPTKEQYRVFKAMRVHVIHLPEQILKQTKEILEELRHKIVAVIYSNLINNKLYRESEEGFFNVSNFMGRDVQGCSVITKVYKQGSYTVYFTGTNEGKRYMNKYKVEFPDQNYKTIEVDNFLVLDCGDIVFYIEDEGYLNTNIVSFSRKTWSKVEKVD